MFKSLLIPVDGSPCSDKALAEGGKLAKTLGAKVVVLYVMQNPVMLYGMGDAVAYQDELYDDLRKQAEGVLETAKKVVRQTGVEAQTLLFEGTRPADVILQEQNNHDLIVMGTHGRKGMSRWFMGSVAEGVLRRAQKPCLIVHSDEGGSHSY
jgi:nucleotide-binding universal stress UspA family protein